jgi:hypothetical protein|tara:strand:- start:10 stop:1065 length:1056 start_codon:yes stop_codon:yes gene_type:complete
MKKSLLGELAERFVTQKENLASEALNIILNKSKEANQAVCNVISKLDDRIEENLKFTTQVHSSKDSAIPDLIGYSSHNKPVVIVEAKFWASLTKNQPETYISRLPDQTPSVLVFLAPQKRKYSLYMEIISRLNESKLDFKENKDQNLDVITLNTFHSICFLNWEEVLQSIKNNVSEDSKTFSDVNQLIGLCFAIDTDSFIPFSKEEISPMVGKRNIDFCDLVDEVVDFGKGQKEFTSKGLNKGATKYLYYRYFKIGTYNCKIKFDNRLWYEKANTPLWFEIFGEGKDDWENPDSFFILKNKLREFENTSPPIMYDIMGMPPLIPLYVKSGLSKDDLIKDIYNQIMNLKNNL